MAPFFELSPNLWFILGGTLCLSSFFLFRKRYLWTLLFALGVLFLSITGFQAQKLEYKTLNLEHAEKQGKFVGSVSTMPTDTETGKKVTLGNISIDGVKTKGSVVIYTRKYPEAEFADQLQFAGKIKKYNQRENSLIKDNLIGEITVNEFQKVGKDKTFVYRAKGILFGIRGKFNEALQKSLPQKEANLASGLILGEKSLLSADQKRALQNSGTSHIVALSGYNITIILSLFVVAQGRLSRRWNLLLPLLFIFLFVVMTGASASVVRAGIMGFMPVLASLGLCYGPCESVYRFIRCRFSAFLYCSLWSALSSSFAFKFVQMAA